MMGPRRLKLITDATSRVPKSRYPGSKSRHFQILAANHDIFGIKMLQNSHLFFFYVISFYLQA